MSRAHLALRQRTPGLMQVSVTGTGALAGTMPPLPSTAFVALAVDDDDAGVVRY